MLYAILKPLTLLAMRMLFRLRGRGQEHVPAAGPVLLVANHSSVLDPPLVGSVTPRPLSFLAKAELFEIPLFGALIRRLNARPVRREGADPAALRLGLKILEAGGVLLVFPEGTRGDESTLRPAKPGAGMLAVLSGAPVVPVYIEGSGRAWPRGRSWPRPARVTVTFGPRLQFAAGANTSRKELYEAASRAMMAAIARLKDAVPARPGVASPREHRAEVGGVGVGGASTSPKYFDGRSGQHGEG